jgi:hypothetical protein
MPTSLESLPRELRQQTFTYAFNNAISEDIKFNDNIKQCLSDSCGFITPQSKIHTSLEQALDHHRGSWTTSYWAEPGIHATHIHDLASALCWIFPSLVDDVAFVLEKSLKIFEEEQSKAMDPTKPRAEYDNHIQLYGVGAEERGELHDDGEHVWMPAIQDENGDWTWVCGTVQKEVTDDWEWAPAAHSAYNFKVRDICRRSWRKNCLLRRYHGHRIGDMENKHGKHRFVGRRGPGM